MKSLSARRQSGMILLAVLWVMVGMTLAASLFSAWVLQSRENAAKLLNAAEAQYQARSLQAAIIYTRITAAAGPEGAAWPSAGQQSPGQQAQPMFDSLEDFLSGAPPRQAGTGGATGAAMQMDGRTLAKGKLRIIVQDRAGLIGLLTLDDLMLTRLAQGTQGLNSARLRDTLNDYMDADQLHRLQGAEAPEYQRLKRSPPLDGILRSPLQLRDIIAWDDALAKYSDAWILENFRVDGGHFLNANSAPSSALQLILPKPETAASLLTQRPMRSALQFNALQGRGEDNFVGISPGQGLRIWWWLEGDAAATVDDIQFNALQPGRDAIGLNWSTRVALSEKLANSPVEQVDHPFFHSTHVIGR